MALMAAYPGTTWQYWTRQPPAIVNEALRIAHKEESQP